MKSTLNRLWSGRKTRTASADAVTSRRVSRKKSANDADLSASSTMTPEQYLRTRGRKRSSSVTHTTAEERAALDAIPSFSDEQEGSSSASSSPFATPVGSPRSDGFLRGSAPELADRLAFMSPTSSPVTSPTNSPRSRADTSGDSMPASADLRTMPAQEGEDDEEAEDLQVDVPTKRSAWQQRMILALPDVVAEAKLPMGAPRDTTPFEELCGVHRPLVKGFLKFARDMGDLSIATHLTWMITVNKSMAAGVVAYCVDKEMTVTRDSALLMREETAYIRTLSTFMDIFGYSYIKSTMPKVLKIILSSRDLEIDPMRELDEDKRVANRGELEIVINAVLSRIFSSVNDVSSDFQNILCSINGAALKKFPDMVTNVLLGSFFFLRFFNPNLVLPMKYKLLKKDVTAADRRKLVLVSKAIQAFVNETQPEGKEAYMESLVVSLLKGRLGDLHHFYDRLLRAPTKKRKSYVQSLDHAKLNAIYFGEHIDPLYYLCRDNIERYLTFVVESSDTADLAQNMCERVLEVFAKCMVEPKLKPGGVKDAFL